MTILETVKSRTWHLHGDLERLPFVDALSRHALPIQSYAAQLRGFALIFCSLMEGAGRFSPGLDPLLPLLRERFDRLCDDLDELFRLRVPDLSGPLRHSLTLASLIRKAASMEELLGRIYVMEGTSRGNAVHLGEIRRSTGLGERGTSFYAGGDEPAEERWRRSAARLEEIAATLDLERVVAGATLMYTELKLFHILLFPIPQTDGATFSATSLNPDAGTHPVPRDRNLLEGAIKAGEICWNEFPYYAIRYGKRGERFTRSDVAWITSLAGDLPPERLEGEIDWLASLLSSRGMPTALLARQLEILSTMEEIPPHLAERFHALFRRLDDRRRGCMTPRREEELLHAVNRLGIDEKSGIPGISSIIVWGWQDRLAGQPAGWSAVVDWLVSTGRITPEDRERIQSCLTP